jgi:predicted enzyme related to lactoylglutathione lyase
MYHFCHVEIAAVNMEREAQLYRQLFGWTTQPMRPGEYLFITAADGTMIGGLTRVDKMPDNSEFQNYVAVANVADALVNARTLGATVTQERRDLGNGMGFIGVIKSPDGFYLGVWSER